MVGFLRPGHKYNILQEKNELCNHMPSHLGFLLVFTVRPWYSYKVCRYVAMHASNKKTTLDRGLFNIAAYAKLDNTFSMLDILTIRVTNT